MNITEQYNKLAFVRPGNKNMPTAYQSKVKKKEQAYKDKQKFKWLNDLEPKEVVALKSALSQSFCATSYLIECYDTVLNIQGIEKHYPLFLEMQNYIINLNTELYDISVKTKEDEDNRLEMEKVIDGVLKTMPQLNIKQIRLLSEFAQNLINKS